MKKSIPNLVEIMLEEIAKKRPFLHTLLKKVQKDTLLKYISSFVPNKANDLFLDRSNSFVECATQHASDLLGKDLASQLSQALQTKVLLTSDHHGPLFDRKLVSGNLIFSLHCLQNNSKAIPVFAFGNVPLNNPSYPQGIVLSETNNGQRLKINLFPDSQKRCLVYASSCYSEEMLERFQTTVKQLCRKQFISEKKKDSILNVAKVIAQFTDSNLPYSDQITKINHKLWSMILPPKKDDPPLVYLQIESVIVKLILLEHIQNDNSALCRMLFDDSWRINADKIFRGIPGAWDNEKGTYFFWAIDSQGRHVSLKLVKEKYYTILIGKTNSETIKINLTPEAISRALKSRQLIPSLLTTFYLTAFYYGFKCYGGFMQVDYLSKMKSAWIQLLQEKKWDSEVHKLKTVETSNYCTGPILSYTKNGSHFVPANGIDIISNGGITSELLQEYASKLLVKEINEPGLPIMYSALYPKEEARDSDLMQLTTSDIVKTIGAHKFFIID